jgi:hypothetical protein
MEGVRISMVAPAGTAYLVEGARQEAVSWQQGQLLLSNAQLKRLPRAAATARGDPALTPGYWGSDPSPQIARMKKERLALLFCG